MSVASYRRTLSRAGRPLPAIRWDAAARLASRGVSLRQIAQRMGVSYRAVTLWRKRGAK